MSLIQPLTAVTLFLGTLVPWSPHTSTSTTLIIWLLRVVTFSLLFRSFLGPTILRLVSKRLRVQSVSLRSIRGIYFRTGKGIIRVDRVGLSYHRPSAQTASRFSIKVEGFRLELVNLEQAASRKAIHGERNSERERTSHKEKLRRSAKTTWTWTCFVVAKLSALVEPYARPALRAVITSALRVLIRSLPILTQVLDLAIDSVVVTSPTTVPGAEFVIRQAKIRTNVSFTQLDNSPTAAAQAARAVHRRFASVADLNRRIKNSLRRTWDRAWGNTQVAASLSLEVEELGCNASGTLREQAKGCAQNEIQAYSFVSIPQIRFSGSVRLDSHQRIERHGMEVSLGAGDCRVDIDVLKYALDLVKKKKAAACSADPPLSPPIYSAQSAQSAQSPASIMSQSPPISPRASRIGWASPISPNSPLMEALSVRFKWNARHHPTRRLNSKKAKSQISMLKSIAIDFPSLTLLHKGPVVDNSCIGTYRACLQHINLNLSLSHPDRVPLHRQWLGRGSAPSDPLNGDVYALAFSVGRAALDRLGHGTVEDYLRIVDLGTSSLNAITSQWPSPWVHTPTFLSGDPNAQVLATQISVGTIEITERLEILQQLASLQKPKADATPVEKEHLLPAVLSPVPRIALNVHVGAIHVRLIASGTEKCNPFALETSTEGFSASANTQFRIIPDYKAGRIAIDPDRPPLQMQIDLHAELHRTFVSVNLSTECALDDGTLGGAVYPGEPILSLDTVQLHGDGYAFGEMTDEVGGDVMLDVPSMFLNVQCSTDALSVELWQPDAVASLAFVLAAFGSSKPAQTESVAVPSRLLNHLPSNLAATFALARLMVFVTGPDLAPGEDLNISRGVAFHMGTALHYCSLRDRPYTGFADLLSRTQRRLQLSLDKELLSSAAGSTGASAMSKSQRVMVQHVVWDLAFRDALSTKFVADDPYGVGDMSDDYRSQEYLRVENITTSAILSGRQLGLAPQADMGDTCAVSIQVGRVCGKLHLAHAYNMLLAVQALKSLASSRPSKPKKPTQPAASPLSLTTSVQCNVSMIQLMWEFPLRMRLYTRIASLSAQGLVSGRISLNWDDILLAVPVDVERDGTMQISWEELGRLSHWSVQVRPDAKPIHIAAKGELGRLRIPFDYVLADLILDVVLTMKSLKHLVHMVPTGQFTNPPTPEAEEAKKMPDLSVDIGCFIAEAADDEFESQLGLIWRTGYEATRLRLERDDAFQAKVETILAESRTEPSSPTQEQQSEFQFSAQHTVPIDEARQRLRQVHAGAWQSAIRQANSTRTRRQEDSRAGSSKQDIVSLDSDLVHVNDVSTVPPLCRFKFDNLLVHLTGPSFGLNSIPDFLHREGGGMPLDTEYSLLVPMHITFSVSSLRLDCREYPLPLLNVPAHSNKKTPALLFDSDVVIAEEMGSEESVEWIDCAVVKEHTGLHGAFPLFVAVPKTIMPVKSYANPIIRVNTDDVTDFAWGVSYGPVTQDIMRVVDTLSHAPRDSSPPIGFWDKLRLIFHWRLRVLFDNEVHLHMKGANDPYALRGPGAGFALCWEGSPQLLIGQKNDQNEIIQMVSDSTLVIIPDVEQTYGEAATLKPRRSPSTKKARNSRKICAKFGSGSRFGVGINLERSCGSDCNKCSGDAFHRQCRLFEFRPHYEVKLEKKTTKPVEKGPDDSYDGFRSDFIHLSISLTSSLLDRSGKHSSIHMSPAVFSHFWAWWNLFDGQSLPIRQGRRYKHKRPIAPKFGQHLATIKYRIDLPRLFLTHVYKDESRDAWADGVTPFVGVKAMIGRFQADMHQRAQESTVTTPAGVTKTVVHKPFYAIEVVMVDMELRALLAVFSEVLKQQVPLEPTHVESTYRTRENVPIIDPSSPWVDMDDFRDLDWVPSANPRLHLLPAASCPRFTYFRRAYATTTKDRVESTKFGDEDTHVCFLGKEASVPQVQMDIALRRIAELREQVLNGTDPCSVPDSPATKDGVDTNHMITLLEDYVKHLKEVDVKSRTSFSNGALSYYMPSDTVSPDEWAEFDNVYQVHCPRILLDNVIRDIMMQYYYCSRSRRGIEYHMATRAVKFIRDQALAAVEQLQADIDQDKHRGAAASAQAAAAQAVRKILTIGGEAGLKTTVEASAEPLPFTDTSDNIDPMRGWSEGVSLQKGHFCLLLKPQLALRSEPDAVCVLAAVQGKLQTYNVIDDANADDPVSGKVMSRNFASLTGLQMFSPSVANKSGEGVVPLEVLIDLRCASNFFDRLVPQTDASLQYDKFNRLRLRNVATTTIRTSTDTTDQMHNHLQSQNDLVRFHVPRFTVSANERHFQAISNIVTNLLLFSNVAHKTRAERVEKLLFSYDFTNLSSAADVVAKLQTRLRLAVETKREAEPKLVNYGDPGKIEKFKIDAHILLLAEELDYVFEAIKLAQDKMSDQTAQKSALLLHVSSNEISWRMIDRQDQLLAKLTIRDIDFRWLNRQDSSTVNNLSFGDLQAFDGAADAEWTEILSKYEESSNHPLAKRKLFCVADWTVLPPVGGITIYHSFELTFHPMRLQIDTRVGSKIMEYVWPSRRKRVKASSSKRDDLSIPSPSSSSSPVTPQTTVTPATPRLSSPTSPKTPRRASADIVSPRTTDSSMLSVPTLRKTATSRSFTDLRKAASDGLQVASQPALQRTKSSDALFTLSTSSSSGQISKVDDKQNGRVELDDAAVMKTRSSQKTFVWVKVSSLHLMLSMMKEDSFLCRDARIRTRDLEYRNQTWSFEELVDQFIPSGKNWKGWLKMAFQQPLVPVLPVAREIISKTKWGSSKNHSNDHLKRPNTPKSIGPGREGTLIPKRLRTLSTMTRSGASTPSKQKEKNLIGLGISAEPEDIPTEQDEHSRQHRRQLLKVFKRRRSKSRPRESIDSISSSSTTTSLHTETPPVPVRHAHSEPL